MSDARFVASGDGTYVATFIDIQTEFQIDRLRWDHDELFGQLTVVTGLAGARTYDGTLSSGTFNFSSPRTLRERAKYLAERARVNTDWIAKLEEVCQRVKAAERRGQPSTVLRDLPRPNPDDEYDVDGLRLPKHHSTILFGDGGTGKSYLALHVACRLTEAGARVCLFDWELDADTHRLRLERLCGAAMPDVRHVRCERPLIYEVDRLKRIVREDRIAFAIRDSIGYACPGPPEAAEHAMSYYRALRQIGVGGLDIAHVRQGEGNDQRPFGSTYWHNSARATWFAKQAGTTERHRLTVGLFNRKANLHGLRPAVGFEMAFEDDRTTITRVNVTDVQELAESLPLWQRMRSALTFPKTLLALSDELGANVDTLDRTVRRKSALFTRVPSKDGITRIALVETRAVA